MAEEWNRDPRPPLTEGKGTRLQVVGIEQGWEIRMYRGGTLAINCMEIKKENRNIKQGDKVELMVGSNDSSNIQRMSHEEKKQSQIRARQELTYVANILSSNGTNIAIVKALPRADVGINHQQEVNRVFDETADGNYQTLQRQGTHNRHENDAISKKT